VRVLSVEERMVYRKEQYHQQDHYKPPHAVDCGKLYGGVKTETQDTTRC
jgi:hypothetical protein